MARNAIESEYKMADGSHYVINLKKKLHIDLKWPEMRSEMTRNVIESEFRTSKMADGSHFVKNFIFFYKVAYIDLKWPEMPSKVNF